MPPGAGSSNLDLAKVRFLDLGSMVYAHETFMPASLFMSYFMLNDIQGFVIDRMLDSWPNMLEKNQVLPMMQARAIIGGSFFLKKLRSVDSTFWDWELYQSYLNSAERLGRLLKDRR
jgi:hypothetical protein